MTHFFLKIVLLEKDEMFPFLPLPDDIDPVLGTEGVVGGSSGEP